MVQVAPKHMVHLGRHLWVFIVCIPHTMCMGCPVCDPGFHAAPPCTPTTVCSPCGVCPGTVWGNTYCTPGCSPCVDHFHATAANLAPLYGVAPPVWCSAAQGSITFDTSVGVAGVHLPGGDYSVSYWAEEGGMYSGISLTFTEAPDIDLGSIENGPPIYAVQYSGPDPALVDSYTPQAWLCGYSPEDQENCTTLSFKVTAKPYLGISLFAGYFGPEQINGFTSGWTVAWVGRCSEGTYSSSGAPPCAPCGACTTGQFPSPACTPGTGTSASPTDCMPCSVCRPGYLLESTCNTTSDTRCTPCPPNFICKNNTKVACPHPSVSPAASSTFLNCSCPAGMTGQVTDTRTALCSKCLKGHYCPGCQC